ncbi:MAG: hypothetical protein QW262_07850 [Candidatus Bathyarchaeia archaeon]
MRVWVSDDGRIWSSPLYGFILRLPKNGADEDAAKRRIFEVIGFINALYDRWHKNKTLSEKDLGELLIEYPKFQLRRRQSTSGRMEVIEVIDSDVGTTVLKIKI